MGVAGSKWPALERNWGTATLCPSHPPDGGGRTACSARPRTVACENGRLEAHDLYGEAKDRGLRKRLDGGAQAYLASPKRWQATVLQKAALECGSSLPLWIGRGS